MSTSAVVDAARSQGAALKKKPFPNDSNTHPLEKELRSAIQLGDLEKATAAITKISDHLQSKDATFKESFFDLFLHLAAMYGDHQIISVLIAHGARPNAANPQSSSPLHRAAANGNFEAVKYLIQMGADPRAKSSSGSTPQDSAEICGHLEIVDFFGQFT